MNTPVSPTATPLKPINLEEIFKGKNPRLFRWIPAFVFAGIKRLICLKEINEFIEKYGDRKGLDFADSIMEYLNLSFRTEGEENLPPPDGRYIFVSNHPFGGPDGIALISFLGRYYPELKFPVNDLLMNLRNLNSIFLPVNKHGRQAREAVREIEAAYASDAQIIMFPAGLCSRKTKGVICDPAWQKNFVTEAVKHQRDIVPLFISGKNTNLFYNTANFRKKTGIKANLEMILLPREAFKKKNASMTIKIGRPIPWQSLDKSRTPREWAETVKQIVYQL